MDGRLMRVALAALLIAALALPAATASAQPPARAAQAPVVTLAGAPALQPLLADLIWFYRQEARRAPGFALRGGGTTDGLREVRRGLVQIGLADRPLGAGDPEGLRATRIASGGACLVTNPANPVPGVSRAQVVDLLDERVPLWSALPGAPAPGVPEFATEAARGFAAFAAVRTPLAGPPSPDREVARSFSSATLLRQWIAAGPARYGFAGLRFTTGLHVVPVDGVTCSRATVANGTYPLARPLALVTRGAPRGEA
ncbi:MAG: substrate-binding domain-containing protein, partial [Solirubrobacteraceae bacterium]|nr:substrate-binding domain-containing protein [Solirubrobacteraceae bacterium]